MLWLAGVQPAGYGKFWLTGRSVGAHRFAYVLAYGPIPEGLHIDHLCRVRACVAPDHLEAVTQAENNRRGYGLTAENIRKTHCPEGHPYTEVNTYVCSEGKRSCRKCHAARQRLYKETRACRPSPAA